MSFKDEVERDIRAVFLNDEEFAEKHTIKYNGRVYNDVPTIIIKAQEKEKNIQNVQSLNAIYATLQVNETDLAGSFPEPRQYIEIDNGTACGEPFFERYKIATVDCAMGMLIIELEALDE